MRSRTNKLDMWSKVKHPYSEVARGRTPATGRFQSRFLLLAVSSTCACSLSFNTFSSFHFSQYLFSSLHTTHLSLPPSPLILLLFFPIFRPSGFAGSLSSLFLNPAIRPQCSPPRSFQLCLPVCEIREQAVVTSC